VTLIFLRVEKYPIDAKEISSRKATQVKMIPATTKSCGIHSVVVVTSFAVLSITVVVVEAEVLEINARAAVVIDVLTFIMVVVGDGILDDVEMTVVTVVVSALEFAGSVLYSVDLLSGVVADVLIDVLTRVTIGVVTDIGIDVLADVNVNAFIAAMTALEFTVPGPLEEFSC